MGEIGKIEKMLEVAAAEIGYMEKGSADELDSKTGNAGSGNYTKYARDMDAQKGFFNGRKQGEPWCSVFVSWCFMQAFGAKAAAQALCQPSKSAAAGCKSAMKYYLEKSRLYFSPEIGDQVFFYGSDGEVSHTGIVEKADGKKITTIEGNTSAGSAVIENGGMVCRKKYETGNRRIAGYGRPNFEIIETEDGGMVEEVNYRARVTITDGSTVNLRKSPSTSASILYRVPGDAEVQVTGHANDLWAYVSYSGGGVNVSGYMMREFLRSMEQTGSEGTITMTISKDTAKDILDAISAALGGK